MDIEEDTKKTINGMELSEIIRKYEESNHQKLEKSLKDFIGYFKKIHNELDMEWTEEDSLNIGAIFDAILERAKLEAIEIMLSTTVGENLDKSTEN